MLHDDHSSARGRGRLAVARLVGSGSADAAAGPRVVVAVISDTHIPRGNRRLPEACSAHLSSADLILHGGDLASAAFLAELRVLRAAGERRSRQCRRAGSTQGASGASGRLGRRMAGRHRPRRRPGSRARSAAYQRIPGVRRDHLRPYPCASDPPPGRHLDSQPRVSNGKTESRLEDDDRVGRDTREAHSSADRDEVTPGTRVIRG